jgi:hypothetical protein
LRERVAVGAKLTVPDEALVEAVARIISGNHEWDAELVTAREVLALFAPKKTGAEETP